MTSLFVPDPPPPPAVKPPALMPDVNAPAALEAARRAQFQTIGKAGRSSTILSSPVNRGGFDNFDKRALG